MELKPFHNQFLDRENLESSISSCKYPATAEQLYRNLQKLEHLLRSSKSLLQEGNWYAAQILLRSVFEHFLINTYLYYSCLYKKNEETTNQYRSEYMFFELFKWESHDRKTNIIPTFNLNKVLQLAKNILEQKGIQIPQKITDDLTHKSRQFDIKKIKLFLSSLDDDTAMLLSKKKLDYMIESYNRLSSFVHGGPSADIFFEELEKMKNSEEIIDANGISDIDWYCSTLSRCYIMLILSEDNSYYTSIVNKELTKFQT